MLPLILAQSADDGAKIGPGGGTRLGWLAKSGQEFDGIVEVRIELQVANECQLVRDPGLHRHQFADVKARHIRLDWPEFSPILDRCVRFQVISINVTRPAEQIDHDNGLRLRPGLHGTLGSELEQLRER